MDLPVMEPSPPAAAGCSAGSCGSTARQMDDLSDAVRARVQDHRRKDELRIVDIALLPESRGHGLGTAMLRTLMTRAASLGKSVSIHVEQMNPAMRLYLRLGFRRIGEHGIYHLMAWGDTGQ